VAIDELQDDLLRQLDELERRTEAVLAECVAAAPASGGKGSVERVSPPQRECLRKAA
jgi:hypothetical protein